MVIVRGVNLFPTQVEELALQIPALSPHFQLELTRPEGRRMDQLTIKVEPREGVSATDAAAAAEELRHRIKTHIGSTCAVTVVEQGSLVRSSGKLRRIYDLRPR